MRKLFKGGNYSRAETIRGNTVNINNNICDHYSRAESNQGRKLLIIRRFLLRKLFKGGNYSRAETIRGNTVIGISSLRIVKRYENIF